MAIFTGTSAANTLNGGAEDDTLYGLDGDDILSGGLGADILAGGAGNDTLQGGRGADTLTGGAGNDTFRFDSAEELNLDRIVDFTAGDRLDISRLGLTFRGEAGFSGNGLEARFFYDSGVTWLQIDLRGYGVADAVLRLDGNQRLVESSPGILTNATPVVAAGTAGNDTLTGGVGNDRLSGGAGNDTLVGNAGNDTLLGGAGNDILIGGAGADYLSGGAGNDIFRYLAITDLAADFIADLESVDRIDFSAISGLRFIGDADFSLTAGELRQVPGWLLFDADGDGQIDFRASLSDTRMLRETSTGSRILQVAASVVVVDSDGSSTINGDASSDRLEGQGGDDVLTGFGGNDRLYGNDGDDTLEGGSGNDTLEGGSGADRLLGGSGNDTMAGGGGNDFLQGGTGRDILRGGSGNDTFSYASLAELDGDTIRDLQRGDFLDLTALSGYSFIGENLFSGAGLEIRFDGTAITVDIDGDAQADVTASLDTGGRMLEAGSAPLMLIAAPDRTLAGTTGDDTLAGGFGHDTLTGGDGNDTLNGGSGNDTLNGGAGNDTLSGGFGDDVLTGGTENDIFIVNPETTRFALDTIRDFSVGDQLLLSGFEGLVWAGETAFSGVRPEARQVRIGSDTRIEIDRNADGLADQAILLKGSGVLKETSAGSLRLMIAAPLSRTGTALADVLIGDAGDDVMSGLAGNDSIGGRGGNDTLDGGAGNDILRGEAGDDTLFGGDGNDFILPGIGRDTMTGGGGMDYFRYKTPEEIGWLQDTITDFDSEDILDLLPMPDVVFSTVGFTGVRGQIVVLESWEGRDTGWTFVAIDIDGDANPDVMMTLLGDMALEETSSGTRQLIRSPDRVLNGTAGNDTLTGGGGRDTLAGNDGNDTLNGLGGSDQLSGGNGNDVLNGGNGDDVLLGEAGNDTLNGGDGTDILRGGDGNDILVGGNGTDTLTGGGGNDIFRYATAAEMAGDTITDLLAGDLLDLSALGAKMIGDLPFISDGTAQLRVWQLGVTMVSVDMDGDGVVDATLRLGDSAPLQETTAGSGILQRVLDLTLTGTAGVDTLAGGAGNDTISGLAGDDSLSGGAGNDTLAGGDGNDTLSGGLGSDTLAGGAGNDIFRWTLADLDGTPADTITDFAVGDRIDLSALNGRFLGITAFSGLGEAEIRQSGAMLLIDSNGDGLSDASIQISGLTGTLEETATGSDILVLPAAQSLVGSAGNDVLSGRGNGDTLSGLGGNDILAGGGGEDLLLGGDGNDTLLGGEGNDRLVGGAGADVLTGGAGNDRFIFSNGDVGTGSARDIITDFNAAPYADQLDLSGIDADLTQTGDQAFTLNFSGSITGVGQLVFGDGVLYGNVDGDLTADFEIILTGTSSLASWNFWAL
ncbi:poly(beta-D-mannuronate) C5 epimerase [Roseomonas sp. GC11]|uniref:calcium-binding protein n=1 Tax=Roseomonas sp. GC11 TaxID=2950546 RepID=UPI00210B86DC|nr:poly(beta-D-mannuronate) C5 epimerase [Roseomonas sp. GC11]MCQ4162037.1 poly(beta-D-mannuronate) C5 epimerase [Roseomonas sp. GC11]